MSAVSQNIVGQDNYGNVVWGDPRRASVLTMLGPSRPWRCKNGHTTTWWTRCAWCGAERGAK